MKTQLSILLLMGFFMLLIPLAALWGKPLQAEGMRGVEKGDASPSATPVPTASPALTAIAGETPEPFRIRDKASGEVQTVPALDFLVGAIAAEMPPTFHKEALKAQGIASYTYALKQKLQSKALGDTDDADFTADPSSFLGYFSVDKMRQQYGERFDEYYQKLGEAAQEVLGKVIVYEGEPIIAAFHAISSGRTEDASNVWQGSAAYLAAVDSSFDEMSPEFSSEVALTEEEVAAALKETYPSMAMPQNPDDWFSIKSRSASGTVLEIDVCGEKMSGQDARRLFGLRSANFGVTHKDGSFSFDVAGYGHDVGLSQYGADYLARQGETCEEILKHYYTGVEIVEQSKLAASGK